MTPQNLKISLLEQKDFEKLHTYLNTLSATTRSRFAPHAFDIATIQQFYLPENHNIGFIMMNESEEEIIAYAIIKKGYVLKDKLRLENYGIPLYPETDCTFAPSISDAWQGKGLGKVLFAFIKNELKEQGMKRVILWGGVQALNERAVHFYLKLGFEKSGEFEKNGMNNFDMLLEL